MSWAILLVALAALVAREIKGNNMSKIGVNISINLSKLDKSRFFQGKNGLYLDLTTFINLDEQDQYGKNGIVKQSTKKDESVDLPIAGDVKVFWSDRRLPQQQAPQQAAPQCQQEDGFDNFDEPQF